MNNFPVSVRSLSDILVVGAVNRIGRRSVFNAWQSSAFGPSLDVVAPGSDILSTAPGNSTWSDSGTSMAAPMVSGVAALILSVNPNLTGREVREIIKRTANRDILQAYNFEPTWRPNGTWNNQVGHGLVDAFAAVGTAALSGPGACCPGATATFSIPPLPPGATVRWIPGDFLAVRGSNNQRTVTVEHTGVPAGNTFPAANSRITVEINIDGRVTTLYRDVVVNRPIIRPLQGPSSLQTGVHFTFLADHNSFGRLAAMPAWSVSPNQDFNMFEQEERCNHTMMFQFMVARNYTVTARVNNACGSDTRSVNVNVTAPVPPPPPTFCLTCGFFPVHHNMPCPNPNCRPFTCPLCGFYPLHYGQACFCVMWRGGKEEEQEEDEEE